MVKAGVVAALGLGLMLGLPHLATAQQTKRAKVARVEQLHNQMENNQKGMTIRMDLEVDGFKDMEVNIAAFFQWQDGKKLTARAGKYSTTDGQVTTQRKAIPGFAATDFKNYDLFIPYEELSLNVQGNYNFRFFVEIQFYDGARWSALTVSPNYNFTLKQD